MAFSVTAEQLSINENSSTNTSTMYSSGPGDTYYAIVTSASYTGMPAGYHPYDAAFTFTLYTSSGTVAGTPGTAGIGVSVSPNVSSLYRNAPGYYKLNVHNDAKSNGTTCNVSWTP